MASSKSPKYALVTGCTPGGIGHFLALEFAARDFQVLATVRDPSKYTPPHPAIQYLPLELTSKDSIQELKTKVKAITSGHLDVLYNNAGRNYTMPALDFDDAEVQELFQANVYSVMQMCQAFASFLIEAKGVIVQTGSIAGVMPYVWGGLYSASKGALHAYSNTLRVELAPLGVRVITVVTGGVKSNIARVHRELPPGSYMIPLADQYEIRLTHSQQEQNSVEGSVYAKRCVDQILQADGWFGNKGLIWEGRKSWLVWFIHSFLPVKVFDWHFTREFQLWRLRGTVARAKSD